MEQRARDIPFASAAARTTAVREIYALDHKGGTAADGTHVETTTGALRAEIARAAICSFEADWHLADAARDNERRSRATSSLVAALSWPAVTDVDPHPTMTLPSEIGPQASTFGYLVDMATAAKAGDAAKLTAATDASSFCHLPSNDRVAKAQAPVGQAPTYPAPGGDHMQAPQPTTYTPQSGSKT